MITTQGVILLGKRGGYIEQPFPLLETRLTEKENLAYFYIRHSKELQPKKVIPPIDYMETQLKNYIKNELRYCLDDFEFFSHKGIEVKMSELTVYVEISDKSVNSKLYFPITIRSEDKVTNLKEFTTILPVRLGEMHKVATKIVTATEIFESALRQEIKNKITSCDQTPTINTELLTDRIMAEFPKLRLVKHESDCEKEVAFCDVWTVKITVQYMALIPFPTCKSESKETRQLVPLTTVYGILDDEAPQHPFTFVFMTKINIDEEGLCNKC